MASIKKWITRSPSQAATRLFLVRNWKYFTVVAILLVIGVGIAVMRNGGNGEEVSESPLRAVELIAVSNYGGGGVAVPTAQGNSYIIRAETGGRVTRVVAEGAKVTAGSIVAEVENSAQRAALTQAEGVYEAALVGSGGNEDSQQTARQDAVRTWTDVTVSAAEIIRTDVDGYYGTVRGTQGASGFKLEAFGAADDFNALRTALESVFDRWETEQVSEDNISEKLSQLTGDLVIVGNLIDRIAALVPRQELTTVYTESDRSADAAALATARAAVTSLQEGVDDARTAITNTSGTGSASAQAQVKQALGALEAARATYAKTLIRTPLAGTILSRSVTVGDVITIGADVALVRSTEGSPGASFALPLTAVKYTPAGAFVFTEKDGVLEAVVVETGLVTANFIEVTGLHGDEIIVRDVRGLKAGQHVSVE